MGHARGIIAVGEMSNVRKVQASLIAGPRVNEASHPTEGHKSLLLSHTIFPPGPVVVSGMMTERSGTRGLGDDPMQTVHSHLSLLILPGRHMTFVPKNGLELCWGTLNINSIFHRIHRVKNHLRDQHHMMLLPSYPTHTPLLLLIYRV